MTIINIARNFGFPGDILLCYSIFMVSAIFSIIIHHVVTYSSCRTAGLLTMQDILNEAAEKDPLENILQHIVTN